jgi:hypothetical protein
MYGAVIPTPVGPVMSSYVSPYAAYPGWGYSAWNRFRYGYGPGYGLYPYNYMASMWY